MAQRRQYVRDEQHYVEDSRYVEDQHYAESQHYMEHMDHMDHMEHIHTRSSHDEVCTSTLMIRNQAVLIGTLPRNMPKWKFALSMAMKPSMRPCSKSLPNPSHFSRSNCIPHASSVSSVQR